MTTTVLSTDVVASVEPLFTEPGPPADLRVSHVLVVRYELLVVRILAPQPFRPAIVGDSGRSRDARAGECRDVHRAFTVAVGWMPRASFVRSFASGEPGCRRPSDRAARHWRGHLD